jgi:hypothetical protein
VRRVAVAIAAPAAAAALLLAGCQSAPKKDYVEFQAASDPTNVASALSERMAECWFNAGRADFADFIYAPELNSYAGRPRVLVVSRADPGGLPKLVVEATEAKRVTSVKLFGPLLSTPGGPRISADVGRWAGGAPGC